MTSVSTFYFGSSIFIPTTQDCQACWDLRGPQDPVVAVLTWSRSVFPQQQTWPFSSHTNHNRPLTWQKTDILTLCSCHHFTYNFLFYSASQASINFLPDPRPHYSLGSSLQHRSGEQCALECTVTSWASAPANLFASPPWLYNCAAICL